MSKPRVDPTFGISSADVLILTERHPACRWREAQPGSCEERENLAGDAKGKGPSGANRKAESTDAPERGGLLRSSEEAAVMVVERRGRVDSKAQSRYAIFYNATKSATLAISTSVLQQIAVLGVIFLLLRWQGDRVNRRQ
jgi:hypothetical protein